jgi:hypothetical protein
LHLRGSAAWAPSHNGRTGPIKNNLHFVGLDEHKDSIAVAVADSGRYPARLLETIAADTLTRNTRD